MRRPVLRLLPLALLLAVAACGSAPNRPAITSTFPAQDQVLPGILAEIRVVYDDPIHLLNAEDLAMGVPGGGVDVDAFADPTNDHAVLIRPAVGWAFVPGVEHTLTIRQGLVANQDDQYMLDEYVLRFTLGPVSNLFLAVPAPAQVAEVTTPGFAFVGAVGTPGGRTPLGLTAAAAGVAANVWVQLATGAGADGPLAWFVPGGGAMTAIMLSHAAGSSLAAEAPALDLSPDGRVLYAAFRDTVPGTLRLHRVDVITHTEIGTSLVLSPPPSPLNAPLGLVADPDGASVWITCRTAADDRLLQVDVEGFTEVDLGPDLGVDGAILPSGGGPVDRATKTVPFAPRLSGLAQIDAWRPETAMVDAYPSLIPGIPSSILTTFDLLWEVQGLSGYANGEGVVYASVPDTVDLLPIALSDDAGAGPTMATAVRGLVPYPGQTRLLALLSSNVVVELDWDDTEMVQQDLDDATMGVQAAALPAGALGATAGTFLPGAFPPP